MIDDAARAAWLKAEGLYEENGVLKLLSDKPDPRQPGPPPRAMFPRLLDSLYAFWEEWHV